MGSSGLFKLLILDVVVDSFPTINYLSLLNISLEISHHLKAIDDEKSEGLRHHSSQGQVSLNLIKALIKVSFQSVEALDHLLVLYSIESICGVVSQVHGSSLRRIFNPVV
ncbi:hypothetical protein IEQ34_007064 [Dendrobium chrysotoxum]|uniref:Uncharacterized protein n=1 Tax=Dendrobium chrysotoxum TaxID=161865 RepID=A0AAV7H8H7_DENCH|nr:hypothetical protein IEQ34_007064 [Dendrobium chrysotoxum]